ncbi:hypothetical protein [Streptomyces sp. NPDC086010]|uniref:hypothetical protein n=1 Tax=Streptomyces sp. NPDC086010 TaxID=3365745 RepID=UPI0037D8D8BF
MTTPASDRWRSRIAAGWTEAVGARPAVDPVKAGQSSVRRRATGMTYWEVLDALEDARIDHPVHLRPEDVVNDGGRGAAVLAEWVRIEQLLAGVAGVYTPDTDPLVQEELAADPLHREAEPAELTAQRGVAQRGVESAQRLGTPSATNGIRRDEEATRELRLDRGIGRVEGVDARSMESQADHSAHCTYPVVRIATLHGLPAPVRAQAVLLAALARTGTPAHAADLSFVGRLAHADPGATADLAAWLEASLAGE